MTSTDLITSPIDLAGGDVATTSLHVDAITHLNELATRLLMLLEEENKALKAPDRMTFLALQPIKAALAEDYELTMKAIRATKTDLKGYELDLRKKLLDTHERLQMMAARNVSLLNMAQDTAHRLQNRILDAARNALAEADPAQYSRGGKHNKDKTSKATSVSQSA
jgi:hypothetical protein